MSNVSPISGDVKLPVRKDQAQYKAEFEAISEDRFPSSLGFSQRLNMLINLAAPGIPNFANGRAVVLSNLNDEWAQADVRRWLDKDDVPSRKDLRNLVRFLVGQLDDSHKAEPWEAFLVYGAETVPSPAASLMSMRTREKRRKASEIIATIVRTHNVPPSSYNAEEVYQQCLMLMDEYRIQPEEHEVQPGHINMIAARLFDV